MRSKWKGNFIEFKFYYNFFFLRKKNSIFSIYDKSSVINDKLINSTFFVHNGKNWHKLTATSAMTGYKVGEFIITRKKPLHVSKK